MAAFQLLVTECNLESTISALPKRNTIYAGLPEEYGVSPFVRTSDLPQD